MMSNEAGIEMWMAHTHALLVVLFCVTLCDVMLVFPQVNTR